MTAGQDHGAPGIVALALDFHRSPTRHSDLLHGRGPLPHGVGTLLKLAAGSAPDAASAGLASQEDLQTAALFFVEQVLFHRDSDHYRVLGLAPGAPADQLKEHHRLLMRLFHPDRENRADDWKDAFATRINLAYTALRDPQARRDYDATLAPAGWSGTTLPAARRAGTFKSNAPRPRSRTASLPPILLRYLPQWVLAGTALTAFLIVGMVYLNNPASPGVPHHGIAPQAVASHPDAGTPARSEAKQAAPTDMPLRPPSAQAAAANQNKPPAPTVLQASTQPVPGPQPKAAPSRADRAELTAAAATRRLQVEPEPRPLPPAPPVVEVATPAEPAPPPVQTIQPAAAPSPSAQPLAAMEAARPAQPDPDATLAQFVATFERGDTGAFMALFDEVAIGRTGGKSNIRREHEALFRSTDLRHIDIDGMRWSREGDWIRGEGRYRTTLMRKGELRLRTETGVFRIQLVRHGDQTLIMGLDLLPGGRS